MLIALGMTTTIGGGGGGGGEVWMPIEGILMVLVCVGNFQQLHTGIVNINCIECYSAQIL